MIHRDLKSPNLLINARTGAVKVCDFGLSRCKQATATMTAIGTCQWTAPEVLRRDAYSEKADVWSFGCTLIEMATGRPPWSQYSNPVTAMYHIACRDTLPDFPSTLSDLAQSFLALCFQRDPSKRPDVTSLLLHPMVTSLPPCNVRHLGAAMYPAGRPATAGHHERPTFGSRGSPFYPPATPVPQSSIFTAAQNKMDGSQHSHTTNGGGEVLCDGDPSNASSATTTSQALSGLEIQGLKGQIPPSLT